MRRSVKDIIAAVGGIGSLILLVLFVRDPIITGIGILFVLAMVRNKK